ncbi:hypothetical protein SVA_0295 [Sulfurifustis variabilis]|uniref:Uncharacterized protein n=1 Tax=Sulfurifustis variabilis TaxID=1675686 RepID=A0A1B4VCU5_9GAMM|nr:hypothetical protein [Sulfurifustis variabilis]BAU46877.1 hypothetical protein SVA_0295 [Sulfurifustis variabilis]
MKCYTVTENGMTPGIDFVDEPYPHVPVGDPRNEPDFRRVQIEDALASSSTNGAVTSCSLALVPNDDDRRRASYRLVPPTGRDDDQALVKLEARAAPGCRTWYNPPRETLTVAKGWIPEGGSGPRVRTPVEMMVLRKGGEIGVYETNRSDPQGRLKFRVRFDGAELALAS